MHSCSRKNYYHNTNVGYLFEILRSQLCLTWNSSVLHILRVTFVPTAQRDKKKLNRLLESQSGIKAIIYLIMRFVLASAYDG